MNESHKRVWLRALRKGAHMTQTEAATAAGISLDHYQNIEYGKRNPSKRVAARLSKLLGFPENLIPIMKPQIEAAMSSPEFWEQYRMANPTVEWPPELEVAYQRVIRAHKDKSSS